MSNEENGNEDLKAFERAMAALRPRADRLDPAWRSLLAKEVSLTAGLRDRTADPLGKTARCDHTAGHRFICLHCGGEAPRAGRVARWAWPGALAAMTSVAAVLLAMLLAGRHEQAIGRKGTSIAASPAVPAGPKQDKIAAAPDWATARPEGPETADFAGIVPRSVAWRWHDGRGVLVAADTDVSDDLLIRNDVPANRTAASAADVAAARTDLINSEFLRRLLHEAGVTDDALNRSISQSMDPTGSR